MIQKESEMKQYLLIFICSLLPLMTLAQIRITGTVTDAAGSAMAGAIIQVRNNATHKIIRFGKTNGTGSFALEADNDCYLEIAMLGFKKQCISKLVENRPLHIVMQEESFTLKDVTVKASKVRERGDTITYNVGTFADRNDRSIGDVLARIPGFEVNKQNGQVLYEGKPISKFYIEGLDMLGGKYGVATNSLPQVDVGSVQVMKNHQPIHVLEDFTFTDETAINIRMKEGAKSHWVTSMNGAAGMSSNTGLWKLETFGLRLKSDFQTMLTYKTNNIGQNIGKETTSLFHLDDMESPSDYISLSPPETPSLSESRTLFNRSHSVTVNTMKRLNESSQVNMQLIYNNNRQTANGEKLTEYFLPDGTRTIDNQKDYLQKDNELYALVKYEKNSDRQYLNNSISGDFTWSRQWLEERGTANHLQYARKPEYDIKDNLYIIRKYGRSLVSFYSDNRIVSRPQSLSVDSLFQHISQQTYSTNTYVMGGTKIGKFNLSMKAGLKAAVHHIESGMTGLPDAFGLLTDDVHFSYARLYIEPILDYKTRDIHIEITPATEYLHEQYSEDKGRHQLLFSPDISIHWYATPRLRFSLNGNSSVEPSDPSRFHRALILQDFQYINQGWAGYRHDKSRSVGGGMGYNDALHAVHAILSVTRSFKTSPYTMTRQFEGNYIILSAVEQKTKSDSWQADLIASKGINLWNGVINLRTLYFNNNSTLLQNSIPTRFNSQMLNARTGLDFSFWKDMHLRYGLTFSQSRMKMEQSAKATNIHNWKHDLSLTMPIQLLTFDLAAEYYHNETMPGNYKDFFLTDVKVGYKFRHFDLTLSLSNLLNNNTYSYVVVSDLIRNSSTNHIRGREFLITLYYRL